MRMNQLTHQQLLAIQGGGDDDKGNFLNDVGRFLNGYLRGLFGIDPACDCCKRIF